MMYWSENEPMSPSPFQSVPLYCAEDAETRISSMMIPPSSVTSLDVGIGNKAMTRISAIKALRIFCRVSNST